VVAVCLERSPETVATLLGVMKTGAAYLPLDPELPPERLAFMLEDSRAAIAIADDVFPHVPAGTRCLHLEGIGPGPDRTGGPGRADAVDAASTIYVIYTSGSTGTPKGVEVTHGAVCNLLDSFAATPGIRPGDRVLALTTLSFDIAVIEIWLPLVTGATVVLVDRATARDGLALRERIASSGARYIQATPSTWRLLLDAGWDDGRGVTAICGGERLTPSLADAILQTGADLWNAYGPTETTVWSSLAHVTGAEPVIPIGNPIANTCFCVLDDRRTVLPAGTVGELYIGGVGLARGYLHRPALTAERFVADPRDPSRRLYRTGDLARQRGDGQFEFLGRTDHQIKIDGYRVEPGEIEAALMALEGVRQAVVTCVEKAPGDHRLAAYVVPSGAPPPAAAALRDALSRTLPAYMIPAAFVALQRLPLTPNGKVDRDALPAPDWKQLDGRAHAPARTSIEAHLAQLWAEVLEVSEVGIDENFFDLGGRSRLGAQLFARIESELGIRLPLATLFESPTVAGLASRLEEHRGQGPWPSLVPIRAAAEAAPFFCVHPVGGNVVSFAPLATHLGPDVSFYGLQAVGLDGLRPPLRSVEEMAARYIGEIRRAHPRGPYALGGASFGGLVAYEMAVQLEAEGERVSLLALFDTDFPPVIARPLSATLAGRPVYTRHLYPLLVRLRAHLDSLRRLGLAGYLEAVRAPAGRTGGPTAAATPDRFMRTLAEIERANRRAAEVYVPRRYGGTVTFLRAAEADVQPDRRPLWHSVAAEVVTLDVPGTHYTMRQEPHVRVLAQRLREALSAVQRTSAAA
jgi:amino acid adenylation domain-containing protein